MRHSVFFALVGIVLIASVALGEERVFRAGSHAIDITPTRFPVDSAGNMTPWKAELAHDPLHARCLVLDNGDDVLAIAVCDSCMIPREIFDAAKAIVLQKVGIPSERILCSATHTHTAVTVTPTFQSEVEAEYCRELTEKIAEGIIQAFNKREPARIGWAVGSNPRQVFNRRWHLRSGSQLVDPFDRGTDAVKMNPAAASSQLLKPAGPVDPQIPVLAVQALDGRPIGVLANYSLHYVGGVPERALSADYYGEFTRQLSVLIDGGRAESGFVAIMSNGTSGDINNIDFFEGATRREPFEQIRFVARDVAQSAHAAYQRIEWRDWAELDSKEEELEIAVRRPGASDVERARKILEEAGEPHYRELRAIYARETLDLEKYPNTVRIKLQAVRIGDVGIAASPCETFVETGLAIKRVSPLPVSFTISLANGYYGYLPTPEQHALGGYETWRAKSSYLAVDAEPKIRNKLLELLGDVAKQ